MKIAFAHVDSKNVHVEFSTDMLPDAITLMMQASP